MVTGPHRGGRRPMSPACVLPADHSYGLAAFLDWIGEIGRAGIPRTPREQLQAQALAIIAAAERRPDENGEPDLDPAVEEITAGQPDGHDDSPSPGRPERCHLMSSTAAVSVDLPTESASTAPVAVQARVDVLAPAGDIPALLDAAVARVLAALPEALPAPSQPGERTVRLGNGARLWITAALPAHRRAHPGDTVHLTVTVFDHTAATGEVDDAIAAVRAAPLTPRELAQLREQMPLTAREIPHLVGHRALARIAPVMVVHHMRDFLVMVETVMALGVPAGAITVLDKGYPYRETHRVDAHLRGAGVRVWPWRQAREALATHAQTAAAAGRVAMLVDDGGYTLPVLLDELPHLAPTFCGLVEQTTSGINRLQRFTDIPVPIFSVAQSRLKSTVESYGIGDAAVRNVLALLPEEKWEGQAALVLGYGRIGEQVAEVLRGRRMRVAVLDTDLLRLITAHERGHLTGRSLPELLRDHRPMLIVGTTGHTSVRGDHLLHLRRDTYLVSVTSRQNEFALAEFADTAVGQRDEARLGVRYLLPGGHAATVLADGFPVNFHHTESLPNRYSDLVLAAMITGMAELARPDNGFAPGHNVAATDRALARCGLLERYYLRYGPAENR